MSLTPEQIEQRRSGIGSSDIGAIIGVNEFASVHDVWLEKLGLKSFEGNDQTKMGDYAEPIIAQMYADEAGHVIAKVPFTCEGREPWMLASPDFLDFTMGCLIECKHVGFRQMHKWGTESDGVPYSYIVQCQWQMHVTGARNVIVLAWLGGCERRKYILSYDRELCAMLESEARRFWFENVVPQKSPTVDGSEGAKRMLATLYPRSEKRVVTPDATIAEALRKLGALTIQENDNTTAILAVQNEIKAFMKDADELIGSEFKVSWKTTKAGTRPFKFDVVKSSKKAA